ncbi:hypothetical protein [Bacteroides neonati]|uniref:hypothetical protein n=1 Tax=Bacteroides neonati TaxID=1347393 RepID=UPI0004B89435|nr:hypothetical protein [Bacteroides neonati]
MKIVSFVPNMALPLRLYEKEERLKLIPEENGRRRESFFKTSMSVCLLFCQKEEKTERLHLLYHFASEAVTMGLKNN